MGYIYVRWQLPFWPALVVLQRRLSPSARAGYAMNVLVLCTLYIWVRKYVVPT